MSRRTCRAIGAYEPEAPWCASECILLACALYSLEHTPRPIGAVLAGDQVCKAKHVDGQLAVYHRHRTPANVFPADPTGHPLSPLFPEAGLPDLRETVYATPRLVFDSAQRESD